jgi:hypothetical protein
VLGVAISPTVNIIPEASNGKSLPEDDILMIPEIPILQFKLDILVLQVAFESIVRELSNYITKNETIAGAVRLIPMVRLVFANKMPDEKL